VTRTIALAPLLLAATAGAQEMPGMPSATAPSPGVLIPRIQGRVWLFEDGQTLVEESVRLEYGLARDLSISAELPIYQGFFDAPRPSDGDIGFGDMDLLLELRILREDLNAIDTVRASLFAGAELPTASGGFAEPTLNPCFGGVFSSITGRHGFDVSGRFTFNTGEGMTAPLFLTDLGDDFANLDAGYAYRIHPEAYGEERVAAWYLTFELNSVWTTGDNHEILVSPGLLIEAPTYAIELGVGIPLSMEVDPAPQVEFAFLAGVRLLF